MPRFFVYVLLCTVVSLNSFNSLRDMFEYMFLWLLRILRTPYNKVPRCLVRMLHRCVGCSVRTYMSRGRVTCTLFGIQDNWRTKPDDDSALFSY